MLTSPALRCFDILELLAEAADGLPLSTIGARLSLPKSATHRALAMLARAGFVRQSELTQRYQLTLKLPQLAFRFIASTGITDVAQPVLDALAARTGELARLAIVDGETLTWVAKAQGTARGLRYDDETGRTVILHATASGKAWLATLDEDVACAIVERAGRIGKAGFGPRVITTLDQLRRELKHARRRGHAMAIEEGEAGVIALAAAVLDPSPGAASDAVATISIAGPLFRLGPARRTELSAHVVAAAREMSALWPIQARLSTRTHAA